MNKPQDIFIEQMEKIGHPLSSRQLDQFEIYYELLCQWNEKMNLTAITDKKEVYVKHYLDSIMLAEYFSFSTCDHMIDIGSGAGFPGIPLKIMFPHIQLTILDALKKRITFLDELVDRLDLQHVKCLHGRAEDFGRDREYRDQYDLATARAVAKLNTLVEICLPFVKPGGQFCALKGSNPDEEIKQAKQSIHLLQGKIEQNIHFQLPEDGSDRHLLWITKERETPKKYPRKAGVPFKNPL